MAVIAAVLALVSILICGVYLLIGVSNEAWSLPFLTMGAAIVAGLLSLRDL